MSIARLITREILHRRLNFALGTIGVVVAVALFVAFYTGSDASLTETKRIMRDMGLNIRILSAETDIGGYWLTGVSEHTIPEEYVEKLAAVANLNYSHLRPVLVRHVTFNDRTVILKGVKPEVSPVDRVKPSMSITVKPGQVAVGHTIARREQLNEGDTIELLGQTLEVVKCLGEEGTSTDSMLVAHLGDVQKMTGLQGRLSEIEALDCYCADSQMPQIDLLRAQIAPVLPDTQVVQSIKMAEAREKQRRSTEEYLALIVPYVMVICAAWIGLLALINVRERRNEIGVLRALGFRSGRIAALFMGKAIISGVIGALIGYALGTWLAVRFGADVFVVTGGNTRPIMALLWQSLLAAPVFAGVAAFIPTVVAVTQDPAVTLREE